MINILNHTIKRYKLECKIYLSMCKISKLNCCLSSLDYQNCWGNKNNLMLEPPLGINLGFLNLLNITYLVLSLR